MARTYDRIHAMLEEVRRNGNLGSAAKDYYDLADSLAKKKIKEFLVDATKDRYLSSSALRKLMRLLSEMNLVEFGEEDKKVRLSAAGKQALQGDNYDRMVSSAALELLSSHEITLTLIHDAIASVELPDVPEAGVIFEQLASQKKADIGFERFRTILFLLYCTKRLGREVKVLYGKRKTSAEK